jgi:hypothetical protein
MQMKADLIKRARWENLEPYLIRRGKNLVRPIWSAPVLYDEAALGMLAWDALATEKCFEIATDSCCHGRPAERSAGAK